MVSRILDIFLLVLSPACCSSFLLDDLHTHSVTGNTDDCRHIEADIVFLLDASSSMTPGGFSDVLHFVEKLVGKFNISRSTVQVGVVTFSTVPHREFDLNRYSDKHHLQSAIHHVNFIAQQTDTLSALKFVYSSSFELRKGARPSSSHIVILITDGVVVRSYHSHSHEFSSGGQAELNHTVNLIQTKGIDVIAIGVNVRDAHLLRMIAGESSNFFAVSDSSDLIDKRDVVAQRICAMTRKIKITTTQVPSTTKSTQTSTTTVPTTPSTTHKGGSPTYSFSTTTTSTTTTTRATTTIPDSTTTTSTTNTATTSLLNSAGAQISQGSVNRTQCPSCDEMLSCVWNQTCNVNNVCMVRSVPGRKFSTHCIRADDCEIMQSLVQNSGGEVYCCTNRESLWDYLGV